QRCWDQCYDPKYMRQQTRVIAALARLGIVPGTIDALAADATEGPLEESPRGADTSDLVTNDLATSAAPGNASEADTNVCPDLVTRVPPGNAVPQGPSLAESTTMQEPRDSEFPGGSLGTSEQRDEDELSAGGVDMSGAGTPTVTTTT